MKISEELIGKDVINESGDQVGIVNDLEWDFDRSNCRSRCVKTNFTRNCSTSKKARNRIIMLTGDNLEIAQRIGSEIGIEKIFAQVLPSQKVEKIKEVQQEGKLVAMVGDGINDAPTLVQSDVGIAIGAGTDVALESADVVLMPSDPLDVVKVIAISKATRRKMIENLWYAAGYNIVAFPIAAGVLYPIIGLLLRPEIAAFTMAGSTVLVTLNALLLNRTRPNK